MVVKKTASLSTYFDKQRELRDLAEKMEALKSEDEFATLTENLKGDIGSVMAKYDLGPEQMLEAVCQLFNLDNPLNRLTGSDSDRGQQDASPSGIQSTAAQPESTKVTPSPRNESSASPKGGSGGLTGMSAPKKVVIRSRNAEKSNTRVGVRADDPVNESQSDERPDEKAPVSSASVSPLVAPALSRGSRKLLTYKNPHTGEVVQTRGKNHRTLNAWRAQFGKDEVENWLESEA